MAGHARNVSEGGIYLSVPAGVSVGTELSCEVSIDGVEHHIRARVAWVHQEGPDRPVALGLQFHELEAAQSAALRSLVGPAHPRGELSRVWVEGIPHAIVGKTEHFEHGAVLRSPIPFLALGRPVKIEVDEAEPRMRAGRIASITLASDPETQVPYLRVEFGVGAEPARAAPELRTDDEEGGARAEHWPRRAGALVVVAGTLVATVLATRGGETQSDAATLVPHVAPPPPILDSPSITSPNNAATENARATAASSSPAGDRDPVVVATPAATPAAEGPVIRYGESTQIEIPLAGSTTDAQPYPLDDPPGLAINLPHASVAFPLGDTRIGRAGIQYLRIARRRDGIQVRLHFLGKPLPYQVDIAADRITISVSRQRTLP